MYFSCDNKFFFVIFSDSSITDIEVGTLQLLQSFCYRWNRAIIVFMPLHFYLWRWWRNFYMSLYNNALLENASPHVFYSHFPMIYMMVHWTKITMNKIDAKYYLVFKKKYQIFKHILAIRSALIYSILFDAQKVVHVTFLKFSVIHCS